MDPISALSTMAGSPVASPLSNLAQGGIVPSIPQQELQQITPDVSTTTGTQSVAMPGSSGASFENMLGDFVGEVNARQTAANDAISGLMSGKNVSLHQAMISMEEASVSFQMMVEVRNKLLDSYQELMRMQI